MHTNSSKGQAALEFLVTYGWAIMIILIAIGALTYIGFTNPSNLLPDKCTFGNGIICQDSQITTTTLKASIINGMGRTIYGVNVVPDGSSVMSACTVNGVASVTLSADTPAEISCTFTAASRPAAGQTKKFKLKLTYKKTLTGFDQTSLGEVYGKVQ